MTSSAKTTIDDHADLRLVRKAKKGNQKSFEKLVERHQKRVYFTIRRIVLDHDTSNDITQDTFVKAFTKLDQYDENYPFYPWLHRIAVNTALNHQKKMSTRTEDYSIDDENQLQYEDQQEGPLEELIQQELEQQVYKAMEKLSPDQRAVFILKTSEGLSYQEISDQLDISIGTVMSRLSRARERLKNLLQPYLTHKDIQV